jgi:hypothetical protein
MGLAANLRKELLSLVDKLVDEMVQIELALWFKENDREALKGAHEAEESIDAWARRMIRGGHDILPPSRMEPEEARAHRVRSVRKYQQRNVSEGKCKMCPNPLDRNSVRYCTKHLEMKRERQREKAREAGKCPRGKHPHTLAALAKTRERQGRKKGRKPIQRKAEEGITSRRAEMRAQAKAGSPGDTARIPAFPSNN